MSELSGLRTETLGAVYWHLLAARLRPLLSEARSSALRLRRSRPELAGAETPPAGRAQPPPR
jgi:hypothetical protein